MCFSKKNIDDLFEKLNFDFRKKAFITSRSFSRYTFYFNFARRQWFLFLAKLAFLAFFWKFTHFSIAWELKINFEPIKLTKSEIVTIVCPGYSNLISIVSKMLVLSKLVRLSLGVTPDPQLGFPPRIPIKIYIWIVLDCTLEKTPCLIRIFTSPIKLILTWFEICLRD